MLAERARRGWQVAVPALLIACSSTPHRMGAGGGSGDGGAAQTGSGSGPGSSGTDFGNAKTAAPGTQPDAGVVVQQPPDCAGQTQMAKQVDVDMYIMLDRSDSMREVTGAGPTKWDAIRAALSSFVSDPQSDGLGVGLQYFPLGAAGIPDSCMADADCGSDGGPCLVKACMPPPLNVPFSFTQCLSDADCPALSPGCAPFGLCELDDTLACFNLGAGGCGQQGACMPYTGECLSYASCTTADYETPAVPIGVLPGNGTALTSSLMSEMPIGLTPTPVALTGAINLAAMYASQNPTHRVITVLATDGLPTECLASSVQTEADAVTEVANIAGQGFALMPSIETYVIGVFSPDDTGAMANLDQIAAAGGSGHAFIVDPTQDVAQQLLDALATIRGGTLDCELQLPQAPAGQTLDYGYVNVELNQGGQSTSLLYVHSADQCDKADLGWYYDSPNPNAQAPSKIIVCPKSCDTLQAAHDATVDIRLGCATKGPV